MCMRFMKLLRLFYLITICLKKEIPLWETGERMKLYHINQSVVDESAGLSMARTDLLHAFQFDMFDDPGFTMF